MLKKNGWRLWLLGLVLIVSQIFSQTIPFLSREFIDGLTEKRTEFVESVFIALVFCIIFAKLFNRLEILVNRSIVPATYRHLDVYALERILQKSYQFFGNAPSGQVLTKMRNLAMAFERLFGAGLETFAFFVTVIVALTALSFQGKTPLLLALTYLFLTGFYAWYAARKMRSFEVAKSEARSKMAGYQSDIMTQAHTVLLFHAQDREKRGFERYARRFEEAWKTRARELQKFMGTLFGVATLFEVCVLWFLYTGWRRGTVTVGDVVLYQALIGNMIAQSIAFLRRVTDFRDIFTQAEEAMMVLDTPVEVPDVARAKALRVKAGEIVLDKVSFGYAERAGAVQGLSFTIHPGERLALVGRSGAGKSTLVKLLLRLYNLESGEIRIDGQPINIVTQASLRQAISYVPQEPLLFHRSIRENIAYGNPDASDRQVIAAAKRAHCHEFISRLPQKYDSLVGERGVKLSGGERQRVAIARAMLKNAPILILDEATSALDPESEQLIQKAMEELMKGKTVIAIAHRLSTIRHMDRVMVLDQGMIADEGTHDELITRKTIYRDFWRRQTEGYRG